MNQVHVRYDGSSDTLDFDTLFPQDNLVSIGMTEDTEVSFNTLTQDNVKTALAQHYDAAIDEFEDYAVIFHEDDITVRPKAEFGN